MVFYSSGSNRSSSQKPSMAISTRNSSQTNPNFSMPVFKWGFRKHLRFLKSDSPDDPLPENPFSVPRNPFSGTEPRRQQPYPSSSSSSHEKPPFPLKRKTPESNQEHDDVQKLLISLKRQEQDDEQGFGANNEIEKPESPKPWNRRTRSATCRLAANEIEQQGIDDSSILGLQKPLQRVVYCEKETAKFSISLSRREIEEDLFVITGNRPSQRPKKRRPRTIQRKVDAIFPGLWLADITPDTYKVADEPETGNK